MATLCREHGCVLVELFARFWKANWYVTDDVVGDGGCVLDGIGLRGSTLRRIRVWTGSAVR